MSKEKLQIGDLVTTGGVMTSLVGQGSWIGLVIAPFGRALRWEVYWFKSAKRTNEVIRGPGPLQWEHHLTKLSPTQEEQNE